MSKRVAKSVAEHGFDPRTSGLHTGNGMGPARFRCATLLCCDGVDTFTMENVCKNAVPFGYRWMT